MMRPFMTRDESVQEMKTPSIDRGEEDGRKE
jgi:hypothetical protein